MVKALVLGGYLTSCIQGGTWRRDYFSTQDSLNMVYLAGNRACQCELSSQKREAHFTIQSLFV